MSYNYQVRSQCDIMTEKALATFVLAATVAGGGVVAYVSRAILKELSEATPNGAALACAVVVLTAPISIQVSLRFINNIAHTASVIFAND